MKGIARKFGQERTKILQITGTIEKTEDNEFEEAREKLEKLIKGVTGLLRNAEKEDENIQEIMDPLKTVAADLDLFFGTPSSQGSIDAALIQTDAALTTYLNQQKHLYVHWNTVLTGLNIIKRKVSLRDEKLLDYDKYRTKLHNATQQQDRKLIEKYERKFGMYCQEYLKLNQDLKVQIAAEHENISYYINNQMHLMYQRQRIMYTALSGAFQGVADTDLVAEAAQQKANPVQGRPRSITAPDNSSSGVGGLLNSLRKGNVRPSKPPPPATQPSATPAPQPSASNTLAPPTDTRERSLSTEEAPTTPSHPAPLPHQATAPALSSSGNTPNTNNNLAPGRRPPSTSVPLAPRPTSTTLPPKPTGYTAPPQTQPVPSRQVPARPLPAPAPGSNHSTLPPTPAHASAPAPSNHSTLPPTPSHAPHSATSVSNPAPTASNTAPPKSTHTRNSLPPTPAHLPHTAAPAPAPAPVTVTAPEPSPPPVQPVQSTPPQSPTPVQSPSTLQPVQTTTNEEFLQLDELGYDYSSSRPKSVMVKPPMPSHTTTAPKPMLRQESFGADAFSTSSWGTSTGQNMFGNEGFG